METGVEKDFEKERPLPAHERPTRLEGTAATKQNLLKKEQHQFHVEFEIDHKMHQERIALYEDNKNKATALLWSQCTATMRSKLQSRPEFEKEIRNDPIKLLEAIKQTCHELREHTVPDENNH